MAIEEILKGLPVVLIAAHPDDETIGAAGLLADMQDAYVVHITDGSPRNLSDARAAGFQTREEYARARRQELMAALEVAGIAPERTATLEVPDQEASLNLAFVSMWIAALLRDLHPAIVLTHPYEGGHPDHDATAFAVHAACARLATPPGVFEFTSYHARDNGIETGCFLQNGDGVEESRLTGDSRERKQRMVDCFTTQLHLLRQFPIDVERYRQAPVYDFTEPPHQGKLFYENFSWGVDGELWRRLAKQAARALGTPCVL